MFLISAGELFLKGKNVKFFEDFLVRNLKKDLCLKDKELVRKRFQYLVIRDEDPGIGRVFGVSTYAKVIECNLKDYSDMALGLLNGAKSFRVTCKKGIGGLKSSDVQKDLGAYIVEKKGLKVSLKDFDVDINVHFLGGKVYLFTEKIKGLGGLPVGVTGSVSVDIQDPKRRKVAEFLMMKRGCNIVDGSEVVIKDLDLKNIKKEVKLTFYPLLGYTDKEVDNLYKENRCK